MLSIFGIYGMVKINRIINHISNMIMIIIFIGIVLLVYIENRSNNTIVNTTTNQPEYTSNIMYLSE